MYKCYTLYKKHFAKYSWYYYWYITWNTKNGNKNTYQKLVFINWSKLKEIRTLGRLCQPFSRPDQSPRGKAPLNPGSLSPSSIFTPHKGLSILVGERLSVAEGGPLGFIARWGHMGPMNQTNGASTPSSALTPWGDESPGGGEVPRAVHGSCEAQLVQRLINTPPRYEF